MAEPFIAEIKIFAGNFAPRNWAFCDGQLLPIAQNTALFSLVGTTYGGDGRTTLGLPNLQGRAPMHPGSGPGLTSRRLGEKVGTEEVTLNDAQAMAPHTHALGASSNTTQADPAGAASVGPVAMYQEGGLPQAMAADAVSAVGSGATAAHENMQPCLTLNFVIALQGLYPS